VGAHDTVLEYREFAAARTRQLFRVAFLLCGDWHEAEDLTQTTLAKLFLAWKRVRHDSADTYARKVLVNTYLSQRRLRRSQETPVADFDESDARGTDSDLRMTLVAALRQLPPRNRTAVVLRYVEDRSLESVAELMGTSVSAVKSLNTRGLAQLREYLGTDREQLFQQ
jgi:RNA polymerase sigma-70 factor (sigma-E family)